MPSISDRDLKGSLSKLWSFYPDVPFNFGYVHACRNAAKDFGRLPEGAEKELLRMVLTTPLIFSVDLEISGELFVHTDQSPAENKDVIASLRAIQHRVARYNELQAQRYELEDVPGQFDFDHPVNCVILT